MEVMVPKRSNGYVLACFLALVSQVACSEPTDFGAPGVKSVSSVAGFAEVIISLDRDLLIEAAENAVTLNAHFFACGKHGSDYYPVALTIPGEQLLSFDETSEILRSSPSKKANMRVRAKISALKNYQPLCFTVEGQSFLGDSAFVSSEEPISIAEL